MLRIRRSRTRGELRRPGVRSRHSFSFGAYVAEGWPPPGRIRAINERVFEPGARLPAQTHRNVDIYTIVLEGTLLKVDLRGVKARTVVGEMSRLPTGAGVRVAEVNPSPSEALRFVEVWIDTELGINTLCGPGARVRHVTLRAAGAEMIRLLPKERIWLQVLGGTLTCGGRKLTPGDGVELGGSRATPLKWSAPAEYLLVSQGS